MNKAAYDQVKKFILKLPADKWVAINSIPRLTDKSREQFINICKQIIDNDDYDGNMVFLEFSNDYTAIKLCTDYILFLKQLKQLNIHRKWD